jgi:hypothetical protein
VSYTPAASCATVTPFNDVAAFQTTARLSLTISGAFVVDKMTGTHIRQREMHFDNPNDRRSRLFAQLSKPLELGDQLCDTRGVLRNIVRAFHSSMWRRRASYQTFYRCQAKSLVLGYFPDVLLHHTLIGKGSLARSGHLT